jgi:hypothetical protein
MPSCGVSVLSAGIYLTISDAVAQGKTLPGRYGQEGDQSIVVTGPSTIITGFAICIFPAYQLIKKYKKK